MHHIYHDVQIDAPAVQVFDAIVNPKVMIHWWPLRCSGEMKLGGSYNFYFTPEYDWYGEVSKFEKDRSFHIKMTDADADWNPTTFGYDLKVVNAGTRVQFFHKDWPACNHHFRRSSYCWALLLKGLKDYVEQGIILPFGDRA